METFDDASREGIFQLHQIAQEEFKPLTWLIKGVIPLEGISLLTSRPKVGKSIFIYAALLDGAAGRPVLGFEPLERPIRVLYMDLENSMRQIQKRVMAHMGGDEFPKTIDVVLKWPRIGDGFFTRLDHYFQNHYVDLVVLDTYGEISRERSGGAEHSYFKDKEEINKLRQFAVERKFSFFLLHHNRKAAADDWQSLVSGTHGLTGTLDTILMLERQRGDKETLLHAVGREIAEESYAMIMDPDNCTFYWVGRQNTQDLSAERRQIVDFLRQNNGPATPTEVALAIGKSEGAVRRLMANMYQRKQIYKERYGHYVDKM